MTGSRGFEPTGAEVGWQGRVIRAGVAHYRHGDGAVVARDKVWHPGAVGILAIDAEHVWLIRQPREVAGLTASLEIPAGKLDVPGEAPLAAAQRELDEEIAKAATRSTRVPDSATSASSSTSRAGSPTLRALPSRRRSASPSCPGRWRTSTRRSPSPRTPRRAWRCCGSRVHGCAASSETGDRGDPIAPTVA